MTCKKCNLHKTCSSIKINGRGSDTPKILFVGDCPGQDEDKQGKVFVETPGQLLKMAIKEYQLTPCRLTNAVKCMTPGQRTPMAVEVEACKPYLLEEIKKYKPEIVVAMGNIALRALTGKNGISKYSGNLVGQVEGAKVFALFHPSFIIRMPHNKERFEMHLSALKKLFKKTPERNDFGLLTPNYQQAKTLCLEETYFVAFDYETTGKYKDYGGSIRCVSFSCEKGAWVFENDYSKEFNNFMIWFLRSNSVKKSAFNSVFERRWSMDNWGINPKQLLFDPYLMSFLLDENMAHDLESVAHKYLGVDGWDIAPKMIENDWTWETVPYQTLSVYSGLDSLYTYKLTHCLKRLLVNYK